MLLFYNKENATNINYKTISSIAPLLQLHENGTMVTMNGLRQNNGTF